MLKTLITTLILTWSMPAVAQLTLRDDIGRPLVVKEAAKRIVTLSPALTELAYAAGAGDLVVGVDSLSEYPPEAKGVAQVTTGAEFSVAQLAALKPDLVLAWRDGIRPADVETITAFGATVFVANPRRLEDVSRMLDVIGRLTGRDASAAIGDFESKLERLRRANVTKRRVTAFLEIWNRPLTTVSGNHFLSDALLVCHADNVFAERTAAAPRVSWEDVAREDPFVIIGAGSASNAEEFRANWAIRTGVRAAKERRLVYFDSEAIHRPSPRALEAIASLCRTVDQAREGVVAADLAPHAVERAAPFAARPAIPLVRPSAGSPVAASPVAASTPSMQTEAKAPEVPKPAPDSAVKAEARRPSQYGL